jgi:hypothetical protein
LGNILDSFWQSAENQKENCGVVLLHATQLRQIGTTFRARVTGGAE